MPSDRLKPLRILVIITLVLLTVQYELGIAVNMSDPAAIPPFSYSLPAVSAALRGVGPLALVHAGLGGLLVLFSLLVMVLSITSRLRGARVWGVLGFLSIVLAADGGLLFVLSGFQNDGHSHQMASMFIVSFAFYFLELYVLKPNSGTSTG